MEILKAWVEKQHCREAYDVLLDTNKGRRACQPTFTTQADAQAYADDVLSGKRKPEIFYC